MIVLDTDHISILQHGDSADAVKLLERMEASDDSNIAVTIITYEEQMRSWLSQIARHSDIARQTRYYQRLIQFAEFFADWELLPFDDDAAEIFQRLRKQKIRISSTDLKIASIVLACEAKLASRNLSDFEQVPELSVESWLA